MWSMWRWKTQPSASLIKNDSGPLLCVTVPGSHLLPVGKSRTKTVSPMVKFCLLLTLLFVKNSVLNGKIRMEK